MENTGKPTPVEEACRAGKCVKKRAGNSRLDPRHRHPRALLRLWVRGPSLSGVNVPVVKGTIVPAKEELPSTLARSPEHAQAIWSKAHDSAVESYGEGERAHRTAFAALKHEYEKVGDRWEKKAESGPSDAKAAGGANSSASTEEGVNTTAPKAHLLDVAKRLKITGRSSMTKAELVEAIKKENAKRTRAAAGGYSA